MLTKESNAIILSSLWAAYGDALGFISELATPATLARRTGQRRLVYTVGWQHGVGGRFGPIVELFPGTYSDDTQLRLATCRAIRGDGFFDIEAFSKIELTIWPSYALGAGRGSRAASTNLKNNGANWLNNFFNISNTKYLNCGGNGAAMRIQPHVWAAKNISKHNEYLIDVLRNSICTHGHPRGFIGAVFHAFCLAYILDNKAFPTPDQWGDIISGLDIIPELLHEDKDISTFWLKTWEEKQHTNIASAVTNVIIELHKDLAIAKKHLDSKSDIAYERIVKQCGGLDRSTRGSGTKTPLFALILGWLTRNEGVQNAIRLSSNLLGSDTDTIGTMVGALSGTISDHEPNGSLLDKEYIIAEANRLCLIKCGENASSFKYPDVIAWSPPKTQLDAIVLHNEKLIVSGLSSAKKIGAEIPDRASNNYYWQWLKLDFGQTIISKMRRQVQETSDVATLPSANTTYLPPPFGYQRKPSYSKSHVEHGPQQDLLFSGATTATEANLAKESYATTIDNLTKIAINSNFDPKVIGDHILLLANYDNGIERAIAYIGIVIKAKMARAGKPK